MDKNYLSFPGLGIEEFSVKEIAFEVFGRPVAWYGIIITCGVIFAFLYAAYRAKKENFSIDSLLDYLLYGMICGVIGARAYYVLTSFDKYYVAGDIKQTLYNCVAIWEGGLAIYGGILAGALTVLIISRIKKQSFLQVGDLVIPGVQMAQAIGRWGNFINAEAHGGVTSLPWRMGIRTSEMTMPVYYHPTFLYESLWNVAGFFLLHFFVLKRRKYHGQLVLAYITWYGFGRMLIEGLRTDSLYIPGTEIRISQLLAFLCFIVGASLLLYFAVTGRETKEAAKCRAAQTEETADNETEAAASDKNEILPEETGNNPLEENEHGANH